MRFQNPKNSTAKIGVKVKVSFRGTPDWYMARRRSWRNVNPEKAAKVAGESAMQARADEVHRKRDAEINRQSNRKRFAYTFPSAVKDNIGIAVVIGLVVIYVAFSFFHS